MRARRLTAAAATIALSATLLAGCAPSQESNITTNPAASQGVTELTFFAPVDMSASSAKYYTSLIDQFNADNPDVHVALESVSTAEGFNGLLEQRLDGGQGDDVFIVNADSVKSLYRKGHFYDMSTFSVFDHVSDAARAQSTIDGFAYCLPFSMNAYCMYVNTAVLDRYKLDVPTNLDEFLHCCEVIKAGGGTPIALNRWYALTVPAMANGLASVYGADDPQAMVAKLNSGELKVGDVMAEGFALMERFIDSGWYGDGLTTETVEGFKAGDKDIPDFSHGDAAFMFCTADTYERIDTENPSATVIATGVPVKDGMVTLPAVSVRLSMNAHSDNIDTTRRFIEYLSNSEMQGQRAGETGVLPILKGQDFDTDSRIEPMVAVYQQATQVPIEDMSLCFTYWDTIRELCIKMFDGYSAEQAVADYNAIQAAAVSGA